MEHPAAKDEWLALFLLTFHRPLVETPRQGAPISNLKIIVFQLMLSESEITNSSSRCSYISLMSNEKAFLLVETTQVKQSIIYPCLERVYRNLNNTTRGRAGRYFVTCGVGGGGGGVSGETRCPARNTVERCNSTEELTYFLNDLGSYVLNYR